MSDEKYTEGKYDKISEELLYRLNAGMVVVQVVNGSMGSGFSVSARDEKLVKVLPSAMDQVSATVRSKLGMMERAPELFGYVGADELGGDEVGLKRGVQSDGNVTALVAVEADRDKLMHPEYLLQLQRQANESRKPIRLIRYVAVEECLLIEPR